MKLEHQILRQVIRSESDFCQCALLRRALDRNDPEWVVEILETLKIDISRMEREYTIPQKIEDGSFARLLDVCDNIATLGLFKKTQSVSSKDFSGSARGSNEDSL